MMENLEMALTQVSKHKFHVDALNVPTIDDFHRDL